MLGLPNKPLALYLVAGFFLGGFVGAFLAFRQPQVYMAEAIIDSPDHSNHNERITLLRARMVERELSLGHYWKIPPDEAAAKIRDSVWLKPRDPQGVLVEVWGEDLYDAKVIARCVAAGLDSPLREQEMAARNPDVRHDPKRIEELDSKIAYLTWQLENRAMKAGFEGFEDFEKALIADREKARKVAAEESTVKWRHELGIATTERDRINYDLASWNPPGEPFKAANSEARLGLAPDAPVSPDPRLWVQGGRIGGALAALVIILGVNRWRPSWLRPAPRPVPPIPHYAEHTSTKDDPW